MLHSGKQSSLHTLLNSLARTPRKIWDLIGKRIYKPKLNVSRHQYNLLRLGTKYGGWSFVDVKSLYDSTIISCGLGEDASFDIEFAARFDAKVIIVDPTPRAVQHYVQISENYGKASVVAYTEGGKQPVEAYEMSKVGPENLNLVDKALWIKSTTLKFFTPPNPTHVSHSIVNFQNNYQQNSDHIEVEAITLDRILEMHGIQSIPLIKLDIEGAEIEVLIDMMEKYIFPQQILVEYDELAKPSKLSKRRINSAHFALLKNGYELIHFESPSDFLYVRRLIDAR